MPCLKYFGEEKRIGQWRLRAEAVFLQFSGYIRNFQSCAYAVNALLAVRLLRLWRAFADLL